MCDRPPGDQPCELSIGAQTTSKWGWGGARGALDALRSACLPAPHDAPHRLGPTRTHTWGCPIHHPLRATTKMPASPTTCTRPAPGRVHVRSGPRRKPGGRGRVGGQGQGQGPGCKGPLLPIGFHPLVSPRLWQAAASQPTCRTPEMEIHLETGCNPEPAGGVLGPMGPWWPYATRIHSIQRMTDMVCSKAVIRGRRTSQI